MQRLPAARRANVEARAKELSATEKRRRPSSRQPRYRVFRDAQGQWRWQLVGANGRVIAASNEAYKAEAKCRSAIDHVKAAWDAEIIVE